MLKGWGGERLQTSFKQHFADNSTGCWTTAVGCEAIMAKSLTSLAKCHAAGLFGRKLLLFLRNMPDAIGLAHIVAHNAWHLACVMIAVMIALLVILNGSLNTAAHIPSG
jgi:hypothetical protein